jgi:hypothetical protein
LDGCDDSFNASSDPVYLWFPSPTESVSNLQWAEIAMDALEELRPVLEPLSAKVNLSGYRLGTEDWRNWEDEVQPLMPDWFVRASNLPETVMLEPLSDRYQISQIPELSKKYLLNWIEKALQQELAADTTHALDWFYFKFRAVRARIYSEEKFIDRQSFKLKTSNGNWEFPLERKTDGLWVYGWFEGEPGPPRNKIPPLEVQIHNNSDGMTMHLIVEWGPWKQKGSPEYNELRQALLRVIARGWEVEGGDDIFQL